MNGVIDTKREFHELPPYKIEELCKVMVGIAISEDDELNNKYENEYKNKMTRFSCNIEFVLRELGWMIYDPLCVGRDEVLFSNGKRSFIASMDYIRSINYDIRSIVNNKAGFLPLTDELLEYDRELKHTDDKNTGLIDNRGYISVTNIPSLNDLASLSLMYDLMSDEEVYKDYKEHRHEYASSLEYVTSKKNSISIERMDDGKITLGFVSENDGIVKDFIDRLEEEGKVAELKPLVQEETGIKKVA